MASTSKKIKKIPVYSIFTYFGKPWEPRIQLAYDSVRPTGYFVNDKWHMKILNMEFYRFGIRTFYA